MTKELFIPKNFRAPALAMIERADAIVEEYMAQGFTLILRQLHYQFVARDLYTNTKANYALLSRTMTHARDAGLIDWDGIEDRSRVAHTHASWESPKDIIEQDAQIYAEDPWLGQRWCPEVWIEKDSLIGIIKNVCTEYRVPYFAQRGSGSTTIKYNAAKRFADQLSQGQVPVVIYLGDHDPTGIDITRDTIKRLKLYAGDEIELRRIALTMAQVEQYRPPPNFAKEKDPNFNKYVAEFGTEECWELDALSPGVIDGLVRGEIKKLIEPKKWKSALAKEAASKRVIAAVADDWENIARRKQR